MMMPSMTALLLLLFFSSPLHHVSALDYGNAGAASNGVFSSIDATRSLAAAAPSAGCPVNLGGLKSNLTGCNPTNITVQPCCNGFLNFLCKNENLFLANEAECIPEIAKYLSSLAYTNSLLDVCTTLYSPLFTALRGESAALPLALKTSCMSLAAGPSMAPFTGPVASASPLTLDASPRVKATLLPSIIAGLGACMSLVLLA